MRATSGRGAIYAVGVVLFAMLSACGGGGSEAVDTSSAYRISATAVLPESLNQTAKQALGGSPEQRSAKSAVCPAVPAGYQPAAQSRVELVDGEGSVQLSTMTDSCGVFTLSASDGTQTVKVVSAGHQAIEASVNWVAENGLAENILLSALPESARYEIAALQFVGADKLSALVVDSVTKKAVLGLPPAVISAQLDGGAVPLIQVRPRGVGVNSQPFSVTLLLDSSGSMTLCAANCLGDPGYSRDSPSYTRYQLAASAAHAFLDGKKESDETSLLVFSSWVYRLNDAQFVDALSEVTGNPVSYSVSADGFTSDAKRLRLPIDYYNRYSRFWRSTGDLLHPITVASGLQPLRRTYPFLGGTALYTAVVDGLNWIATRPNQRRIVIAMTDGMNNAGSQSLETAVLKAQSLSVPVYTIGYGLNSTRSAEASAIDSLRSLANQTGAESSLVNGTDIVGLFAGLQTAIRFETGVQLGQTLTPGQVLTLIVANNSGEPTVRQLTVPDLNPRP